MQEGELDIIVATLELRLCCSNNVLLLIELLVVVQGGFLDG